MRLRNSRRWIVPDEPFHTSDSALDKSSPIALTTCHSVHEFVKVDYPCANGNKIKVDYPCANGNNIKVDYPCANGNKIKVDYPCANGNNIKVDYPCANGNNIKVDYPCANGNKIKRKQTVIYTNIRSC